MSFNEKNMQGGTCTPKRVRHGAVVWGLSLALALVPLAGCATTAGAGQAGDTSASEATESTGAAPASAVTTSSAGGLQLLNSEELFSARDLDASYDEATATRIELAGTGAVVTGDGAVASGSTVTITAAGTYVVSGTLADGQIVVEAADDAKVQIVLAGADVTSSSAAALYVKNADKVFLTLAEGTSNSLVASGASTRDDTSNVDGAVFSKCDLTVNGTGSLDVRSEQGHGIVGKDELTLVSGTVSVTAAGHAIQANDSVAVAAGTWRLTAGTDGIHCANDEDSSLGNVLVCGGTIEVTSGSDGIDAGNVLQVDGGTVTVAAGDDGLHAERDVAINGGTITVTQSYEALEGQSVTITAGELDLTASDDGINAAGAPDSTTPDMQADSTAYITVSGGVTRVTAGGDCIDSNGNITVSGGELYVSGPAMSDNEPLDCDGTVTVTGGIIVGTGAAGMGTQLDGATTQGVITVSASGNAGDTITLADEAGNVLASYVARRAYTSVTVSAPGVESGGTYTLTCGSTSAQVTLDGLGYGTGAGMGGGPGGEPPMR